MTTQEKLEIKRNIQKGLELNYKKLLAEKKATNSEIIVLRDNKIVAIKP